MVKRKGDYGSAEQMRPAATHGESASSRSGLTRRQAIRGGLMAAIGLVAAGALFRYRANGAGQRSRAPGFGGSADTATDVGQSAGFGTTSRNIIEVENARVGTSDFTVRMEKPYVDQLHAWCDHDSAHTGDMVTVFASTEAKTFTAEAFRFGHYGGAAARLIWKSSEPIAGVSQAPPTVDATTKMRSCAHWTPSFTVEVTDDWTPGMYMFRLIGSDGGNTFVPLTVTDDRRADVLVISAISTWNAYNRFGGAGLYDGVGGRSEVVSFDRPYDLGAGSGHFFGGEFELVQLVESMGLDVAYTTSIDLHARPEQIANGGYKVVISLAHDEYYSVPMRQALESARDGGVNLMFLGANAVYRRIRFEPSPHGSNRLEVNFRSAKRDPLFGVGDQELVTSEWRAAPAARPEASLIGNYYESNPCLADMVVVSPASWVFAGTGLKAGQTLAAMVQNEYDRVTPEVPGTPANIEVLCHSPLVCRGRPSFGDVTYYTAASQAGVFATGTLWWERQLGPLCTDPTGPHSVECHIRRITANVLQAFVVGPSGFAHPSVSNLAALGIAPGYVVKPPGSTD